MGMISNNKRQISIYYDGKSKLGKTSLAAAEAADVDLKRIDLRKEKVPATECAEIANLLDVKVVQLINKKHRIFREIYGDKQVNLDAKDAIKILKNHPETLVHPIAIRGKDAIHVRVSTDLRKLINPDSK